MRRTLPLQILIILLALALAAPIAEAGKRGKKKRGKKAPPEPTPEEPAEPETPPSMFEHISTSDFVGDLKVERYKLTSNGLSVLLVADHAAPTFSYHTYFNVGSSDEVEGKTGLAHLFEHMMFKATDGYDDSHFSQTIERSGGPDLNAWTWLDTTAYHVSLPSDKLDMIAGLESTRMDGLKLDQAGLDTEREVVRNERKYSVDNLPSGAINERLWALAFETNRYHWPTIGWDEDIKGYQLQDLMAFYKDYYAPNNATVVVVGDIDIEEALGILERHYGDIQRSTLNRVEHGEEAAQIEARRLDIEESVETETFQLGYKVPSMGHADWPALTLVDALLTAGNSARLQRRMVDSGWATSASGFMPPFQHEALYEISVSMRPGKAADAGIKLIRDEIADLAAHPLLPEELERARALVLRDAWMELTDNKGRAGFLGFNEVSTGDWKNGLARLNAFRAVSVEDVQRVVSAWLTDARSSVVVARPKGQKKLSYRAKDLPTIPTVDPEDALPSVIGRPRASAPSYGIGEVQARDSLGWTRMTVYDPTVPLVFFQFVLPYGSAVDPAGKEGLANLCAELLLRGTKDRSRDVFERTVEGLGGSLEASVSADHITFEGSVLSENWPKLSTLLAEALELPAFDKDELTSLIEEVKADIIDARNSDRTLVRTFAYEGLFGDSPYGKPEEGTIKSLGTIHLDDVRGFYTHWFNSQGVVAAVAGDIDADIGADLSKVVGKLIAEPREAPEWSLPPELEGRKLWLVDKPERSQTQMYLLQESVRPEGERYAAAWIANEAFGGFGFGARMMQEVREKRGWSYGAYASWSHMERASTYWLYVFPATEDAVDCLSLVYELYEKLQAEGLTADELDYARGSIVNGAAFYTDTPRKRLNYEVRKKLSGEDPLSLMPAIRAMSLEEVNEAAKSVFDPENLFGVVVATAKDVQAGLEALVGAENVTVKAYDAD